MKIFDMILERVMIELDQEWYEVVDGDGFEIVEARCSELLGCDCWLDADFLVWAREQFADL